jgi:hypothetical protein
MGIMKLEYYKIYVNGNKSCLKMLLTANIYLINAISHSHVISILNRYITILFFYLLSKNRY